MHRWISYVFYIDRYIPFPNTHTFVIGCGNETSVVVDECNCVNGAQMAIVLLYNITAACIPLYIDRETEREVKHQTHIKSMKQNNSITKNTHAYDLFIGCASNK